MQISSLDKDDITLVQFNEDEQLREPDSLQTDLYNLINSENKNQILLDLENVSYISSSVLGLLITISRDVKKSGGAIKIVNAQPSVSNVFRMTRLDRVFEMFGDKDEALRSFAN